MACSIFSVRLYLTEKLIYNKKASWQTLKWFWLTLSHKSDNYAHLKFGRTSFDNNDIYWRQCWYFLAREYIPKRKKFTKFSQICHFMNFNIFYYYFKYLLILSITNSIRVIHTVFNMLYFMTKIDFPHLGDISFFFPLNYYEILIHYFFLVAIIEYICTHWS